MKKVLSKKTNTNKVFVSLFISYVIVFLVPLTVALIITCFSSMLMLGQVADSSKASLRHAKSIMDAHIENAFFNTSSILTNTSVASLRYKETFSGDDIDDLQRLQRTMGQVSSQDYFLTDLYIVFNKSDAVLSSQFLNYGDGFRYNSDQKLQMDYEEFKNSLVFEGTRKVSHVEKKKGRFNLLLYNKNTHNSITKDTGVTVIATINPDNLRAVLDSLSDTENDIPGFYVYLADSEGNIIESASKAAPDPDLSTMKNINDNKAAIYYNILLNRPLYATADSSAADLQYVFVQNKTPFSQAVLITSWVCLIIIILGAVLGIRFCHKITYKQYSPMQMLIDRMLYVMENNNSAESAVNEYELIERSLTTLIKQKRNAENQVVEYKHSLADSNLRDMLKGYVKRKSPSDSSEPGSAYQESASHQCIIYSAENLNFDLLGENDASDESILDLISAFICTIVNDYDLEGFIKQTTILDDNVVCLIQPEENSDSENITKMVNETVAHIKQSYNIDIIVGISDVNKGFNGISRSYSQANEVLEYSSLLGLTNSIMYFYEIPKASETDSLLFPELSELEHRYFNCIKACDFVSALAIQDEIITICFRKNKCTPEQTRYRLYGIINIAMTGLEDVRPLIDDDFWNSLNINERMLTSNISLKGFIEYSDELYNKLQNYFDNKISNESSERDSAIVAYVNDNYTDSRMSIALLADIFEMSPSYLSKTFKKATGKGLLDYIHTLRIEKAKELIKSTDKSLKVIAEEVGYSNNLTLIRAFKRYEGITPSTYKEM